jgi:invasion protein IalB
MMFKTMKRAMRTVLICAGVALAAGTAIAQTTTGKTVAAPGQGAANGTQFGDWTLRCVAEGVGETSCALVQRLAQSESGAFVAEVGLSLMEVEGARRVLLILLTPDGTALNLNPAFVVDDSTDQTAMIWRTCAGGICRAGTLLEDAQTDALRKGQRMTMGYQRFGAAEPFRIAVSLTGVAVGLAALEGK